MADGSEPRPALEEVRETMNQPPAKPPAKVKLEAELVADADKATALALQVVNSLQEESYPAERPLASPAETAEKCILDQTPLQRDNEVAALEGQIKRRELALSHMEGDDASEAERKPVLDKVASPKADLAKLQKRPVTHEGRRHAFLLAKQACDGKA